MNEIDCDYTDEAVCPYCGYEYSESYEIFHDTTSECAEGIECENCENEFNVTRHVSVSYSSCIPRHTKQKKAKFITSDGFCGEGVIVKKKNSDKYFSCDDSVKILLTTDVGVFKAGEMFWIYKNQILNENNIED